MGTDVLKMSFKHDLETRFILVLRVPFFRSERESRFEDPGVLFGSGCSNCAIGVA